MNIETTKTLAAFVKLEEKMGNKMEFLTMQVHKYLLESGFLETHGKRVLKAVNSIVDRNDELLVQTFIGKLVNKLPNLHMGLKLHEYDKKRARLIASSLITQVMIDNGSLTVDKRVESVTVNHQKKFHTRLYLQLGGSHEKNLLKGYENKPGVVNQKEVNGWKLSSTEKSFLRKVSSVPFCITEMCTKELLLKGYSLKTDWGRKVDKHGKTLPEDPIVRRKRFEKYADVAVDQVKAMPVFYLPAKYCGRDRVYYEAARLEGIKPHGKLWETLMIDAAVPFELTEDDSRVLQHIIYVTLHGRVSVDEAVARISAEDLLIAQYRDPMVQETEEAFGETILLNKAAQALKDSREGKLSKFMFGYDFTNSGLLMSGVSFRSEKMMKAGNIGAEHDVVDSHTAFGSAYDLPLERSDIKKIHMGLMHGSAISSIAKTISETVGDDVTEADVHAYNENAYGKPVENIPRIADWGTKVIGNEQVDLRWTMPDGFSACSRAYYKSVPVLVYVASASYKGDYTSHVIISDMPWLEDKNGFPYFGKEVNVGGVIYHVEQKKRGLFANATHSIDAYMLRKVTTAILDSGRPILLKHDDFISGPSALPVVTEAARGVFNEMFETNFYQSIIDEIIERSPYDIPPFKLVIGDGPNTINDSFNFLMP